MANDCEIELTVIGSPDSIGEFEHRMEAGEDARWWLAGNRGISGGLVYPEREEDVMEAFYAGCVAWSLASSFCSDGTSFAIEAPPEGRVTLEACARDLDLDIEAFSKEPGMCFAEHVRFEAGTGRCLADETVDYVAIWWDPEEYATFEEFKAGEGLPDEIVPQRCEPDEDVELGGFADTTPAISVEGYRKDHERLSQSAREYKERIERGEPLCNPVTGQMVWNKTLGTYDEDEIEEQAKAMEVEGTWHHATVAEQLATVTNPVNRYRLRR
jgi:hypothetical protein